MISSAKLLAEKSSPPKKKLLLTKEAVFHSASSLLPVEQIKGRAESHKKLPSSLPSLIVSKYNYQTRIGTGVSVNRLLPPIVTSKSKQLLVKKVIN